MGNLFVKKAQVKRTFPGGVGLPNHSGVVSVTSNTTVITVSTTSVKSDSAVFVQAIQMLQGSMFTIGVDSRVDAVSFAINLSAADAGRSHPIAWSILG